MLFEFSGRLEADGLDQALDYLLKHVELLRKEILPKGSLPKHVNRLSHFDQDNGEVRIYVEQTTNALIPRESVRQFSRAMENILQQNDHKDGWEHMTYPELYDRLTEELQEVKGVLDAVEKDVYADKPIPQDVIDGYEEVQREVVDVANFCMFVYDNAERDMIHWKVHEK